MEHCRNRKVFWHLMENPIYYGSSDVIGCTCNNLRSLNKCKHSMLAGIAKKTSSNFLRSGVMLTLGNGMLQWRVSTLLHLHIQRWGEGGVRCYNVTSFLKGSWLQEIDSVIWVCNHWWQLQILKPTGKCYCLFFTSPCLAKVLQLICSYTHGQT